MPGSKLIQPLSEAFTVMEFDCSRPISPSYGKTQVNIISPWALRFVMVLDRVGILLSISYQGDLLVLWSSKNHGEPAKTRVNDMRCVFIRLIVVGQMFFSGWIWWAWDVPWICTMDWLGDGFREYHGFIYRTRYDFSLVLYIAAFYFLHFCGPVFHPSFSCFRH